MCNFFSCIVTRSGHILYNLNTNHHDVLIDEFDLDDGKIQNRDFVRIEMRPTDGIFKRDKGYWPITVDEKGTLPVWFESEQREIFSKLRATLDEVFDKIDTMLVDASNNQESVTLTAKLDKIRDHSYLIYDRKHDYQYVPKDIPFKEAYNRMRRKADELFDEACNWYEDNDLYAVFDEWESETHEMVFAIRERPEILDSILKEYVALIDDALSKIVL